MKESLVLGSLLIILCSAVGAQAASPKNLGRFGYWQTYLIYEGKDPVCYMTLTAPAPGSKDKTGRGNIVLMVTHRPAESAFDIVSYAAGARFAVSSDLILKVDGRRFVLFTKNDTAWAKDSATDKALTMALRRADHAIILGRTEKGQKIADDVGLRGSNGAYKAISKACSAPVKDISR